MKVPVISLINFENYVNGYMQADDVRKAAFIARVPETKYTGDDFYEGTPKQKYDVNYDRIFGPK